MAGMNRINDDITLSLSPDQRAPSLARACVRAEHAIFFLHADRGYHFGKGNHRRVLPPRKQHSGTPARSLKITAMRPATLLTC